MIYKSRGKSSDVDSNYENKILVQYKENVDLDDELKVINKIYDRFYQSQKPPNKKSNNQYKTKFYKYIPKNALYKDNSVYLNKSSYLEKKKKTDQQYKQRHMLRQKQYFNLLDQKVKGLYDRPPDDEFTKKYTNPAFKYLGLSYKSSFDMNLMAPMEDDVLNSPEDYTDQQPPPESLNKRMYKDQQLQNLDPKHHSRRIGSLNYNRFEYLYQFKNDPEQAQEPSGMH